MQDFIIASIAQGSYLGILLLMMLENIVPPIPSEVIMGVGGVLVARGEMHFWPLLLIGTVGATAGNYLWFWIGDKWGYRRLEPFIARWGRWLTVEWHDIERASRFFRRHGQWVVLVMRCSPFLRTIISLPAGLAHMSAWRFLLFTFVGSALWNGMLIAGGHWLAEYFDQSQQAFNWIVMGLTAMGVGFYLWRLLTWKPRAKAA
jgi:membrane protein DedA with SNARE-associated domain